MSNPNTQDWKPVVFTRTIKNAQTEGIASTKASGSMAHYQHRVADRLDAHTGGEDDPCCRQTSKHQSNKHKSLRALLVSYRASHKLTQKGLAIKLNLKPDVVASLESGKMIADPPLVQRIKNTLHTTPS